MATPAKIVPHTIPTIALVGRVNVGKSTLFNRLIEQSHALVSPRAGTTRTRNVFVGHWRGEEFRFVDTGGLTLDKTDPLQSDIEAQIDMAFAEANVVLFLVDGEVGAMPEDRIIAKELQKLNVPVRLVVNKIDNARKEQQAHEFSWSLLGLGQPFYISGINGRRSSELLDEVCHLTQDFERATLVPKKETIKVSLIGRPNVGKSNLFNALIGQESVIVSSIPHTTREPFDTEVKIDETYYVFIDTAGIRRKALIKRGVEFGGVSKSLAVLKKSDVALLLLETGEKISSQDKHLAGMIADSAKSVIIVVNKWDLTQDTSQAGMNEAMATVRAQLPFLSYAPIIFVSAKTKAKVHKIFPLIRQVYEQRNTDISDAVLAEFLKTITKKHLPSRGKGTRQPKLLGMKQLQANPPIFQVTVKQKTSLHRSYIHFIENRLREHFGFIGTPLIIKLRKSRLN